MDRAARSCIFCLSPTSHEPEEHIVGEGLIGQECFRITAGPIEAAGRHSLVLKNGEVCGTCNGEVAKLDEYLQRQLGFVAVYLNRGRTKRGKRPSSRRPGMYAEHRPDGPHVVLNLEQKPIETEDGVIVAPTNADPLAVSGSEPVIDGSRVGLSWQQPIRMNKRFIRALHKIGFELLCFQKGSELTLGESYDPIRNYVLKGIGSRTIAFTMSAPIGGWETPLFQIRTDPRWPGWLATIRLGSTFYIDLSPDNAFFANAKVAELRKHNIMLWSDRGGGRAVPEAVDA